MTEQTMRAKVIATATEYLGTVKGDDKHRFLVDTYNLFSPKNRSYKVGYTDSYCATAVSAWFILADLPHLIDVECGVYEMIQLAMSHKMWVEDDNYTPTAGDLVCFNFDGKENAENTLVGKHIALVSEVKNGNIVIVNPNADGGKIVRSTYKIGHKSIRGFIIPKYKEYEKREVECVTVCTYRTTPQNLGALNRCKVEVPKDGLGVRYKMYIGERVELVQKKGNWVKVRVDGRYVWFPWVHKDYVKEV